jgi:hypothetical protein
LQYKGQHLGVFVDVQVGYHAVLAALLLDVPGNLLWPVRLGLPVSCRRAEISTLHASHEGRGYPMQLETTIVCALEARQVGGWSKAALCRVEHVLQQQALRRHRR